MTVDTTSFKICPSCGQQWSERQDVLDDPEVSFLGYQAFVRDGVLGLFMFNHLTCGTTMTVSARDFEDLRAGGAYEHRHQRPEKAPSYCLSSGAPDDCPQQCECGFVREVVAMISDAADRRTAGGGS